MREYTVNRRVHKHKAPVGPLEFEDISLAIRAKTGADAGRLADEAVFTREQRLGWRNRD